MRNTVVVTDGWLDQLAGLAEMDPEIGLCGPMTVAAAAPQHAAVAKSAYGELRELDRFARRWREERRGQWQMAESLASGCVLIRRRVLELAGDAGGLSAMNNVTRILSNIEHGDLAAFDELLPLA